jgi:zinc D-Ala-D-Ala carboxypeptidase
MPELMLSPHISLAEFTASQAADRAGIDNDLPAELLPNARATAEMLQRIRKFLSEKLGLVHGAPILITSGYRGLKLNAILGGSKSSDHMRALAADWHCPVAGRPTDICRLLAPQVDALGIGQLINEFPSKSGGWIHTSTETPRNPANRIITITRAGVRVGIHEG